MSTGRTAPYLEPNPTGKTQSKRTPTLATLTLPNCLRRHFRRKRKDLQNKPDPRRLGTRRATGGADSGDFLKGQSPFKLIFFRPFFVQ